jgi:hypothetical protein
MIQRIGRLRKAILQQENEKSKDEISHNAAACKLQKM